MHGIVHKSLKSYVVEKAGDETWNAIVERANIEPTLYLPISRYDDAEVDAALSALASMAVQDRPAIERDFGRALAPELRSTFDAHLDGEAGLLEFLVSIETITANVERTTEETTLPDVTCTRERDRAVVVRYDSHRDYCDLARGVLEGLVAEFDAAATVTERACTRSGADDCAFLVELERP
ncbi:heme NO-binding domain-containing protein [Natronococcus wangiae]|uniref:heme NO-binding domain-containing protein n=1 Tax=Natronococcus wangiae TaxID=3068275 RepID=UPI00273D3E90|nr:heme NO-binding domain-containing protein [Natronococcus sp. AD5]